VLTLAYVGAIVYRVRKRARPIIAIVGGIVCVVNARRTNARTMTIRVNDVIITKRLGKIARPVKIITNFIGVDQSFPAASLLVALSSIVTRSLMLGTAFAFTLDAALLLWAGMEICLNALLVCPSDGCVIAKMSNITKKVLIILQDISPLKSHCYFAVVFVDLMPRLLHQPGL